MPSVRERILKPSVRRNGPPRFQNDVRAAPFAVNGSEALTSFVDRVLDKLPRAELVKFCKYLAAHGANSVGSMCSGTDSPLLVLRALKESVGRKSGLAWPISHGFSVEKEKKKRHFLRRMFDQQLERLYHDCTSMMQADPHCDVNARPMPVPPVQMLYAGFPCQDVSRMHKDCKRRRLEVAQGRLRTGTVFKAGVCDSASVPTMALPQWRRGRQ